MALQPHSRIESQLTDPTYKGPYLSRIELILKDMLENYGRIAFVGPYDSLEDLPETGQAGYVYLVRVEGSNLCDEYIWDEQEEEYNYVGRFEIDLDDYQTKDLSNPITIDSVVYTTVEAALAAMNASLSNVSRDALKKVSTMPQNPSNNDLVVWHGNDTYKVGHTYKYVEGTGETLYAWQVDNPGGVGDGTVIYTKSAIPNEDTNIYKSDGTAYSSSTDDPTYELMVGGESAITIEIFSSSQMQSWERSALRKSSEDIVATSGEWVEVTKDNIQDDWEQSDSSAPDYIKNKPMLGTAASRNATNQITEGSTALPEAGAVKTALDSKEKSGVAETLVKDTVGWIVPGKNKWNVGNDISEWLATGSNGTKILGGSISTRVTADIDADTSSIKVTNYDTTGWWSMSKVIKLEKNTNYKLVNFGNITKWVVGLSSLEPETIGTEITVSDGVFNSGNYDYWIISIFPNAVDVSNMMVLLANESDVTFEPYHATVDTVKADKVTNATSGHLAGLDSNGNLTDSGVSPTEEVTVEGNPVMFGSPFEQDAKSIVVNVKPIQDLHGYDHPWVGGAGKNIAPLTVANLKTLNTSGTWSGNVYSIANGTFEALTDNGGNVTGIKVNGTFNATVYFIIANNYALTAGNYRMANNCSATIDAGYHTLQIFDASTTVVCGTNIDKAVELSADTNVTMRMAFVNTASVNNAVFTPILYKSDIQDATFAPYSNICPISGIDELEIGVSGKNLLDINASGIIQSAIINEQNGDVIYDSPYSNNFNVSDYITINGGDTYIYSSLQELITHPSAALYDEYKRFISFINQAYISITMPINAKFIRLEIPKNDNNLQFELGSTPTAFEPYNPNSHTTTIPLPSTLYGGTVDVTEGTDTPTYGMVDLGSLDYSATAIDNQYFAIISSRYKAPTSLSVKPNWICESYDIGLPTYTDSLPLSNYTIGCFADFSQNNIVFVRDPRCSSAAEMKTALNGVKLTYELATPETPISLTPKDVELLEGTNVVTTNGEKVAVTYGRSLWQDINDLKRVDAKIAEGLGTKAEISAIADSEPNATASQPYAVREHFYKNGKFCTAISEIASGATFTKGTNYVEGTIANNMVKQAVFSGTTSSDGNLKLSNSVINILSAIVTDMAWCVAIPYVSNGNTFIHVIADDGSNTVRSSTAISGIYFYI